MVGIGNLILQYGSALANFREITIPSSFILGFAEDGELSLDEETPRPEQGGLKRSYF